MSELRLQHTPFDSSSIDSLGPSQELESLEIVNSIISNGVEIDDSVRLAQALEQIRGEFEISDDVFSDFGNALVLTAVANRYARITGNVGQQGEELQYLSHIIATVNDDKRPGQIEAQNSNNLSVSDVHKKEVFDKYSQPELTEDLNEYLHNPDFDELRRRLGVQEDSPYELRVLSIDTGDSFGLVPSVDWNEEGVSHGDISAEEQFRKSYQDGLLRRTSQFNQDLRRDEIFAPAWVTHFDDGTKYLCVTSALAEKIMYPSEERASYYTESSHEDDLAILKHEFTHTQGEIADEPTLGIALEELRAEHFSGNKHGYTDVKRFFMGVRMITGYDVAKSFEPGGQPYSKEEFFADIARNIGIDGFLDCMVAIPNTYVDDEESPRFIKELVQHNGGLSGLFQSFYEREVSVKGEEVVENRISDFVDIIYDRIKKSEYVTLDSFLAYGGIASLHDIAMQNFKRRYTQEVNT